MDWTPITMAWYAVALLDADSEYPPPSNIYASRCTAGHTGNVTHALPTIAHLTNRHQFAAITAPQPATRKYVYDHPKATALFFISVNAAAVYHTYNASYRPPLLGNHQKPLNHIIHCRLLRKR